MNRPRQIGTYAETAVVRYARTVGFPWADRVALHGVRDVGDVTLCPGVIVEVKAGQAAAHATDLDVENWLDQTDRERLNARAAVGFLVLQRAHVGAPNAGRWWAYWRLSWLGELTGHDLPGGHVPARMRVADALDLLRAVGYGTSFDDLPPATPGR